MNEFGVKRMGSTAKLLIWGTVLFCIIGVGILTAYLIDRSKELAKNNIGVFEISLSNSGAKVSDSERSLEFTNVKIGERDTIKLTLNLGNVTRSGTYAQDKVTLLDNGVYVRLIITGEVFDVDENGKKTVNSEMTEILKEVIETSPFPTYMWRKEGNVYYYNGGSPEDSMLLKKGENIFSSEDIVVYFNSGIVNGSWFDKVVKLNFKLEAIDYLSVDAESWRE